MSDRATERTKLTASYVNGVAIAIFAIGCFTPVSAALIPTGPSLTPELIVLAAACTVSSAILHSVAWVVLGDIPEGET